MKKTIVIAVALAACAATQLFAQNAKQNVIAFNLTRWAQNSISTSATANNAGSWSQGPLYYKTTTSKVVNADILKAISIVLYKNPGHYNASAQLVLVQGEMGGFFGYPYTSYEVIDQPTTTGGDNIRLAMGRNMTNNPISGALPPGHNQPWGQIYVKESAANGTVTLCDNVSFFFAIQVQECYDCFYLNSFISDTTFRLTGSKGPPCCAGTSITVGSGIDRYYMTLQFDNTMNNPYLNDREYVGNYGNDTGPAGASKTISIKNEEEFWGEVGNPETGLYGYVYRQNLGYPTSEANVVIGLIERDDGVNPDGLPYTDSITSTVSHPLDHHTYDLYTLRFSLNGILSYNWALKFINKTDVFPDFVGSAILGYPGGVATPGGLTGYGYALKVCSLFTGTVTFTETIVANTKCCLDNPWYATGLTSVGIPGGPTETFTTNTFWYGIGDNDNGLYLVTERGTPYFWDTGDVENYYDTSYWNSTGDFHVGDDVPVNTDLDLSFHCNFNHNYEPLEQATEKDYPQPGFEGYWPDYYSDFDPTFTSPDDSLSPYDWQPPQGDGRYGDYEQSLD